MNHSGSSVPFCMSDQWLDFESQVPFFIPFFAVSIDVNCWVRFWGFLCFVFSHFLSFWGCISLFCALSSVLSIGALRPKNICVNFINFSEAPILERWF